MWGLTSLRIGMRLGLASRLGLRGWSHCVYGKSTGCADQAETGG